MSPAWTPELVVDASLARPLIAASFPDLADAPVEPLGSGWDNAAFLVGEQLVFRFPQRTLAVALMEREIAMLPMLAPQLPLPIPHPRYVGTPSASYPWPFAGYERIAGITMCTRVVGDAALARFVEELARFLRALHDLDPQPLLARGLLRDTFGKLSPERLEIAEPPLDDDLRVVHGDLYARHLLVDEDERLCGVIDWGDLHYGSVAVDLSALFMLAPSALHDRFFATYGPVRPRVLHFARARARRHASHTLEYARSIGDAALEAAARRAFAFIAASE
ncbi:MAG: phosphotransferase [bacterium]|nr:phosphotransferase [bacterium]